MQSKKVSSASRDFDIDDYIGMESCADLKEQHTAAEMSSATRKRDKRMCRRSDDDEKEYPPPIPLLVRTENLASHMPWVLKRHYTGDGRLILTEEKVGRHEFFRAHRSDGRLMLQLVAVDDHVSDDEEDCAAEAAALGGGKLSGRDPAIMFGVAVAVAVGAGSLSTVQS